MLFVSRRNPIYANLRKLYDDGVPQFKIAGAEDSDISASDIHGIQGIISADSNCTPEETFLQSPGEFAEDLTANFAISVVYDLPEFPRAFVFPATILPGAKFPEKSLKPKYFGGRANAAPRDWQQNNHRSGSHIGPAGQRMVNHAMPNSSYQETDKTERIGLFGVQY